MNIFEQTPPNRRRYGLAAFIGLIAGVVSAFVKWGAEVPLPPRSPVDMFNAACGPESLIRAAGQIDCSRNFLNPPYIFLRDWLGLTDPNAAVYTFAGHVFKEGANKRGNSSRLTQSFHFFMFEPIFSPVNALNQPI